MSRTSPPPLTQSVSPLRAWKGRKVNESNSTEWLVQPKRVCQTWFLLLSYLRYKWSRGEETGLISDKTSNPWAPYVEKSIADFERGLTQRPPDGLTPGQSEQVRQMIQNALDTGSA